VNCIKQLIELIFLYNNTLVSLLMSLIFQILSILFTVPGTCLTLRAMSVAQVPSSDTATPKYTNTSHESSSLFPSNIFHTLLTSCSALNFSLCSFDP